MNGEIVGISSCFREGPRYQKHRATLARPCSDVVRVKGQRRGRSK